MPNAPWPAAGSMSAGSKQQRMRCPSPRRFRPAAASTMASKPPSSSLRKRVSRLPRSGSILKSGRSASSCTTRRRLEVPTTAPGGSAARLSKRLETQASRGSSRASTAASSKPSGSAIGTSLSECTARWARPSASACSNSLTNRPLPPTLLSARSRIWSPRVVMPSRPTARPKRSASSARTCSACHSASRLSRVAINRVWGGVSLMVARLSLAGFGSAACPLAPLPASADDLNV